MDKRCIKYKDGFLSPGSEAFQLHQDKKFKELAEHMTKVEAAAIKRGEFNEVQHR